MADLPEYTGSIVLSSEQRHRAALSLAERFAHDKQRLALHLVQLGLAVHQKDGSFTASVELDGTRWFSRHHDGTGGTLVLTPREIDDER